MRKSIRIITVLTAFVLAAVLLTSCADNDPRNDVATGNEPASVTREAAPPAAQDGTAETAQPGIFDQADEIVLDAPFETIGLEMKVPSTWMHQENGISDLWVRPNLPEGTNGVIQIVPEDMSNSFSDTEEINAYLMQANEQLENDMLVTFGTDLNDPEIERYDTVILRRPGRVMYAPVLDGNGIKRFGSFALFSHGRYLVVVNITLPYEEKEVTKTLLKEYFDNLKVKDDAFTPDSWSTETQNN